MKLIDVWVDKASFVIGIRYNQNNEVKMFKKYFVSFDEFVRDCAEMVMDPLKYLKNKL